MAILGVNSFDNRLYFVTQEEEKEMSVVVEEEEVVAMLPQEVIATLPDETIKVSDALAKEHLDCNVERLVRLVSRLGFCFSKLKHSSRIQYGSESRTSVVIKW